jgi:hypothetical protein
MIERQDQVAKMGRIYEESLRVFVYLGEDIVCSRPSNPKHPARHQLHTLGGQLTELRFPNNFQTQARIDLEFILKRRYFSRVWVIQELILSRQALIPVGDVEFMADYLTSKNLESRILRCAWDETGAPWFKHVARRRLPATNMLEVMGSTSKCDSADPRDKIFGILGILGEDKILSAVRPDYSLSYQHVYIGIFSCLLLNLRHPQLLRKAAGIFASLSYPSWWPDRSSAGVFAEEPDLFSQDVIRVTVYSERSDILRVTAEPARKRPSQSSDTIALTQPSQKIIKEETSGNQQSSVSWTRPWYQDATINTETGVLSINLIYLLRLTQSPQLVKALGPLKIFEVKIPGDYGLYIVIDKFDLNEHIPSNPTRTIFYQAFVLGPYGYLIG